MRHSESHGAASSYSSFQWCRDTTWVTYTHKHTLSSCTYHQKIHHHTQYNVFLVTKSNILYQRWRSVALCSAFHLGTSIPPSFSNWPTMNGLLSFLLLFPSSSSVFLSPHPPLSLFSEREEVRGWVCEPSLPSPPFLLPLASCFPSLSVFSESKRWAGGPLMYTEKEKGPFEFPLWWLLRQVE